MDLPGALTKAFGFGPACSVGEVPRPPHHRPHPPRLCLLPGRGSASPAPPARSPSTPESPACPQSPNSRVPSSPAPPDQPALLPGSMLRPRPPSPAPRARPVAPKPSRPEVSVPPAPPAPPSDPRPRVSCAPCLPAVPRPQRPPPAPRPRGGARHFAAAAAPGARGPLNCSQNGWRLDQLICKIGVNQLIRGPHAGRGAEAFAMQRGRGPRRVFIWGNGNQAAHKAAPRAGSCPRPPSGGVVGACRFDLRRWRGGPALGAWGRLLRWSRVAVHLRVMHCPTLGSCS